jgi:hypothetical protein
MRKRSRRFVVAFALIALGAGGAQASTLYTISSASVGAGEICSDLACTGGPTHTLSSTPQGAILAGAIGVTGTSISSFSIELSGPFSFSPSGSVSTIELGPSFTPNASLTSSNCLLVGSNAFCGATFRIDGSLLGGSGYSFLTLNITATQAPEPAAALLLAGVFAGLAIRSRWRP